VTGGRNIHDKCIALFPIEAKEGEIQEIAEGIGIDIARGRQEVWIYILQIP
jgi:hypothetical protein